MCAVEIIELQEQSMGYLLLMIWNHHHNEHNKKKPSKARSFIRTAELAEQYDAQ